MPNENIDILNKLQEIKENYKNCIEDYNKILKTYSYKKMSIGDCIYGMYHPDHQLEKYFKYKGKLTNNEKKKNFSYYFDKNGRLILTERYSSEHLLNIILYYYYEDKTDIVWYCMNRKRINIVGVLFYHNDVLIKFIESGDVSKKINSFKEYIFNEDEYISVKSYMNYSNGEELIMKSKLKK